MEGEFWIDEKRIKGVVKDSVKVEKHRERICFVGQPQEQIKAIELMLG